MNSFVAVPKIRWMRATLLALGLLAASAGAWAREVLIDVRTPAEFQSGHLPGAINIPHTEIGQGVRRLGIGRDDQVLLYCRSGNRSGQAQQTLKGLGFSRVDNLGSQEEARRQLAARPAASKP